MTTYAITDEDRESLDGCRVVASVSGGKDSAALSLWLTEQEIEHDRIFADTGWEHPDTYRYIRGPLSAALGRIREVRGPLGFADLCRKKGMFPSRLRRFCTTQLKIEPIRAALDEYDCEVINAVGIRAAESLARGKMCRWEEWSAGNCQVWRPLLEWTEADVIDIHRRHGLHPNPLYLRGATRVGCWPCIFSRKSELRLLARLTPGRIEEIELLEKEVGDAAKKRMAAKRTTLEAQGYARPTLFFRRSTGSDSSIREIIRWANTARGGRQCLLLETEPEGCIRWGLCEPHHEGGLPR